jgi:hypothetical protein
LSPFLQIRFVAHNVLFGLLVNVFVDLFKPISDIVEGSLISDIVDDDDAVGSSIVAASDGLEPVLASSIPLNNPNYTI